MRRQAGLEEEEEKQRVVRGEPLPLHEELDEDIEAQLECCSGSLGHPIQKYTPSNRRFIFSR
jgi:hypothetical protein